MMCSSLLLLMIVAVEPSLSCSAEGQSELGKALFSHSLHLISQHCHICLPSSAPIHGGLKSSFTLDFAILKTGVYEAYAILC